MSEAQPGAQAPAAAGTVAPELPEGLTEPSFGRIIRDSGPRLVVSGLGPYGAFYLGWRTVGLILGIALATAVSALIYAYERRRGRPGVLVRVSLALAVLRAVAGVATRSANVYFGLSIGVDLVVGALLLASVPLGRPLIGLVAGEAYPFPVEVAQSQTFRRIFGLVSMTWGLYFAARGCVRTLALATGGVNRFLLVATISDTPMVVALIAWSIWFSVRSFRQSEEWGEAIQALAEQGRGPTAL